VQRAKASGLGALSNSQGMTIMGTVLLGNEPVVGAAHIRWTKFIRTVYGDAPPHLQALAAEAQRNEPDSKEEGDSALAALATLSKEERLSAVRDTVHRLAREVVNDDDLSFDAPLLESGMDSLSGVEFRNRLLKGFHGVRIPNSAVFDYPTVGALASFVDDQLDNMKLPSDTKQTTRKDNMDDQEAEVPTVLVQLNDRDGKIPLFFVPGAGMQAGTFRTLATLLPVPAYGISWPNGFAARSTWPSSLTQLATLLLDEIRKGWPTGPYLFAGHSFGASLCLEMTRLAEISGDNVLLVGLLDPRSLPPISVDIGGAFGSGGLVDSLTLLSQTVADGSRYEDYVEELLQTPEDQHPAAVRRLLSPAALVTLEHVHETSQWYAHLLGLFQTRPAEDAPLRASKLWLSAGETWKHEPALENRAHAAARSFQAATFQSDSEVADRLPAWFGGDGSPLHVHVPGGHFAMLHEPHVTMLALRLSHALVEAGIADA